MGRPPLIYCLNLADGKPIITIVLISGEKNEKNGSLHDSDELGIVCSGECR